MNTESVKKSVVQTYGKLAKSRSEGLFATLFSCCDTSEVVKKVSHQIGYTDDDLASAPENANLGVGCGNPSSLASLQPGQTVVDFGSGAGFDAFLAAAAVGAEGQVVGVDLSDHMLQLANRNKRKGDYQQVSFIKGDIENVPLPDDMADVVISNCVINLSMNKQAVFDEAYRVLKPGGRISISDIVLEKEWPNEVVTSLASHVACIAGAELLADYVEYVKRAGFDAIRIESTSHFPLELMLSDPQVIEVAKEMKLSLSSKEAEDLASHVISISLSAQKSDLDII